MEATFFKSQAAFHDWLAHNHERESAIVLGLHKKGSGLDSVTHKEAVDEALCFGWIDGITRRIDEQSYCVRFTPRKRGSIWSAVNIARATALREMGRMAPAGLAAFEGRDPKRADLYSSEQPRDIALDAGLESTFRANERAWAYWQSQPPGYRRTATWWVISAKRDATRASRLATLIADCEAGRRVDAVTYRPKDVQQ